jgi:hypothetical protein
VRRSGSSPVPGRRSRSARREQQNPEKTLAHYCVYVEAIKQHVYTPAYVQKLVELLSTEEGYRQTVGTALPRKVTTLPTAKKATPAFGTSSSA